MFNSEASQSFISVTFFWMNNLIMKPLQQSLVIVLRTGEVVVRLKVDLGYLLVLDENVLEANLKVFNLLGFDIILGIDWLF